MTPFAWILLVRLFAAPAGTPASDSVTSHPVGSHAVAAPGEAEQPPAPPPAPPPEKQPPKDKAGPTCRLPSEEGPRGGRLVIEGEGFGRTPVVRIGDRVTRILVRQAKTISVQIPADSDGGPVTVEAEGIRAPCGWLTIVGKDR